MPTEVDGKLKFTLLSYNETGTSLSAYSLGDNAVDEFKSLLSNTTDITEQCRINLHYGKILQKMKRSPKALQCFESIVAEAEKDIKPVGVDEYAYKAHQRIAKLYYEMLCFKTAKSHLEKAEEIIVSLEPNT